MDIGRDCLVGFSIALWVTERLEQYVCHFLQLRIALLAVHFLVCVGSNGVYHPLPYSEGCESESGRGGEE